MDELFEWECKNADLFTSSPKITKNNETQHEDSTYLLWLSQLNETSFGEGVKLSNESAIEVVHVKKMILSFLTNPINLHLLINQSKIGFQVSTLFEAILKSIMNIQQAGSSEEEKIEQILTCVLYVNSFGLSKSQVEVLLNSLRLRQWLHPDPNPRNNTENYEVDYLKLTNEMASSHFREYIQLKTMHLDNNDMYVNQTVLPMLFKGDAILNEVIHQLLNELKYEHLLSRVERFVKSIKIGRAHV